MNRLISTLAISLLLLLQACAPAANPPQDSPPVPVSPSPSPT